MHTEHLTNVRSGAVVAGWFIAIAVSSAIAMVMVGFDVNAVMAADIGPLSAVLMVFAGFFVGGFFAGIRAVQAPVLHGIAIGLFSLVAWVGANLIASALTTSYEWTALASTLTLGLILTQMLAATLGALIGYNIALRGKPGISE